MSQSILQSYWNNRTVIRREAARSGSATLAERLAWQDVIRRHIGAGRNLRVLDVGSGCGITPSVLNDMKHRCTAVDWSQGLLEVAQQRSLERGDKTQFVQSDCTSLDFPNAAFAAVVAVNVLSTLAQPREAVAEWARVLKPGGKLVVIEDDRLSADFPTYFKQLTKVAAEPHDIAYRKAVEAVPLWHAIPSEIAAFLKLNGWIDLADAAPKGQLLRRGKAGLGRYELGYQLISATKPGSIKL